MPSRAMPSHPSRSSEPEGPLGRRGFETGGDLYERARPDYPDDAIDRMTACTGIRRGSRVLDLAAGTGKLTRRLSARGTECVAVEPSASMREVFRRVVPSVPIVAGTAEHVPLVAGWADAVVVAQAFHWFDPARALSEIARVLRPRGWLALVWNERDDRDPTVAELARISKWDDCQPYPVGMDFGEVVGASTLFGPVQRSGFSFVQHLGLDTYVDQVASRSYVQVLPEPERRALLAEVRRLGSTLDQPIPVPYRTDLFCAQLRG